MSDPISQTLAAVSTRSGYAPALVFSAGLVSSIGPCVAPRFIAAAGMTAGKSRSQSLISVFAFVTGLIVTYALFGALSSLLTKAVQLSAVTYLLVSLALGVGGTLKLWQGERECGHSRAHGEKVGTGAAFLLGTSFALVVSPCCTPLVLGIVTIASAGGNALYGTALLACFALGHTVPVLAAGIGMNGVTALLQRYAIRQVASVVSAALMIGLAGYYALLA